MKKRLLTLAAAAALAACAGRSEDETGAAPSPENRAGDTTAVTHEIDTTRTGPPGAAGRPGNATVTADSVAGLPDTVTAQPGAPADTTAAPQDTLGPTPGVTDTSAADTSLMQHDTMPGMQHDSAARQ